MQEASEPAPLLDTVDLVVVTIVAAVALYYFIARLFAKKPAAAKLAPSPSKSKRMTFVMLIMCVLRRVTKLIRTSCIIKLLRVSAFISCLCPRGV